MKFWWWTGAGGSAGAGNFGDIITPAILDHFKIPYEYSKDDYQAISTGSIIKKARAGTIVLGSGIIGTTNGCDPQADYRFVRGPLTQQHILNSGGQCPKIYGDPAMLLPLIRDSAKKKYDLGLIPHWSQYERVKNRYPKHFVVNMRTDDPMRTLYEITQCRSVASSSLHGIITAHAYDIPAALLEFDPLKGDGTKFLDHYQAVNVEPELSTIKDPKFSIGSVDLAPIVNVFQDLQHQIQCA
jgi:hypothetical protein